MSDSVKGLGIVYSRPICCCCCYYLFGCVFNKLLMYHHHHHQCRFLCIRFITSKYCNKRAIVMFEINAYWIGLEQDVVISSI